MSSRRYQGKHFASKETGKAKAPAGGSVLGAHGKAKVLGIALAGTALCGFGISQTLAVNATADAQTSNYGSATPTTQGANVDSSLAYSMAKTPSEKDETVYVFSKADGSVKNTTVSTKLTNKDKAAMLKDQCSLSDLSNVEGDGAYNKTDEGVVWDANKDNIYYQGNTDKEAPVKVKVSYKLDGKDISPDQLVGKSGKVKIRFDYTNTSYSTKKVNGKDTCIYTPFLCLTGLVMDNDNFSDVKVKNGKMLDDGDRTFVGGYAMPGFSDDLDLSKDIDLDISDYVEIEANAKDFKLNTTFTVVTSDIFNDAKKGQLDLDKLGDSIDQLQNGMTKLIDGSGDLSKGLGTLSTGAGSLASGANQVKNGTAQLASGTSTLKTSTKTLPSSVKRLNNGMKSLDSGIDSLSSGLNQLTYGTSKATGLKDALGAIGTANDSTSQTLVGGINLMKAGVTSSATQLSKVQKDFMGPLSDSEKQALAKSDIKTMKAQLGNAIDGIDELQAAVADLPGNTGDNKGYLSTTLSRLSSGLQKASAKIDTADAALDKLTKALGSLDTETLSNHAAASGKDAQAAATAAGEAKTAATKAGTAAASASKAASALDDLADDDNLTEAQKASIEEAKTALNSASDSLGGESGAAASLGSAAKQLGTSAQTEGALAQDVSNLRNALSDLPSTDDITEIQTTLTQAKALLSTKNLQKYQRVITDVGTAANLFSSEPFTTYLSILKKEYANYDTLADDLSSLSGTGSALQTLSDGLDAEKAGLLALRNGGTAPDGRASAGLQGAYTALDTQIVPGVSKLGSGSSQLAAGTSKLNAAAPKLYNGVVSLNSGAQKLKSGTVSLANGAGKLSKGAKSAAAGAQKLKAGLEEYNEKGIKKIVDAYNDNLAGLGDRLDAIIDAGKGYDNFSGITKGTKGHVKFVYETDSIGDND